MKAVYKHNFTEDLYAVSGGDLGRHVGLSGERYYDLVPVIQLVDAQTKEPVLRATPGGLPYEVLNEEYALTLVVSARELEALFSVQAQWRAIQNSPMEELLARYTAENCDFTNLEWAAHVGLRAASNSPDGQSRCILHTLATETLARLDAAKA